MLSLPLVGCNDLYINPSTSPVYNKPEPTNPYLPDKPKKNDVVITPLEEVHISKPSLKNKTSTFSMASRPVSTKKPLSLASVALITEANNHSDAGDLESAVVAIERALRIDSRNPTLIYKLAQLRLKQEKPRLAEDLAKKAALLSATNRALKKQSWLLISEARKKQSNFYGAKEAKLKADSL